MMKKVLLIATAALLFLASCQKEDSSADAVAPVPPAAETLAIDLDSFRDTDTKSFGYANDFFAYVSVKVVSNWIHIYDDIINVPVEAYKELIISSTPVQSGNGWIWTVDYKNVFNQHYTVTLYGEEMDDIVNWELRVSRNDGAERYENFTWLTGWSSKDGRNGQWEVLVGPDNLNVVVTADWNIIDSHDMTVKLTYELEHQHWGITKFFNESYIVYSTTSTDEAYDSSFESYYNHDGLGFWNVKVEWNRCTGSGRVMSSSRFGDSHWHCWDNPYSDEEPEPAPES